jgi:hypothetical protein
MTREEARKHMMLWVYSLDDMPPKQVMEALTMAADALRPISRKRVEKAWRGCKYCDEEWGTCDPITNRFTMPPRGGIRFCPMCGRPLTDEAVQMVMERLEALRGETETD